MSIFYFEYKSNVKSKVVLIDYVSLIEKLKKNIEFQNWAMLFFVRQLSCIAKPYSFNFASFVSR